MRYSVSVNRDHLRQLRSLLVHPDPGRRLQGQELLSVLPAPERLDVVRWLLSPRRRLGRGVLGPTGAPLIELPGVDLREADLSSARAEGAILRGADLSGADLSCASLRDADLRGACLEGAEQACLDLSGADVRGAIGIDRSRCWSDGATRWR